ncbi:hypothetical protein NX868_10355 [Burkholderia thailandensis]|uniref:hypothetical protein n=1 Tax=Burkholderia thailandensis TaxID=57975 RepID=UPI00217EFD7B|nr:hypothetical protein [Burkholderia thailandensis]MCS6455963.1 hypothetical protein [Burkholderia thailandensis]MCS6482678.1 hypothetical protein [Burkholderia thailandensis]MCS6499019.1 hypothetical protein [Burkholderia thailandensis]HDR9199642.1 hypothetical protein [Burkholderia vietnamiensis]
MEEHNNVEPPLELLIEARPEILVGLNKAGTVDIIVNSMNEASDSIQRESVCIPLECCDEIGNALIALASKHLGK